MKEHAEKCIHERLTRIAFEMRRARHTPDEEAVHDLRVSIRRLWAALRYFREFTGDAYGARMKQTLKPVMKLAGEVRNRDIALAFGQEAKLSSRSALVSRLTQERKKAVEPLRQAIAKPKWRVTIKGDPEAKPTPPVDLFAKFHRRGAKAARDKADWDDLHRFRLQAKRLRYVLEIYEPFYGPGLKRRIEKIRKIQQVLGEINDAETVLALDAVRTDNRMRAWLRKRRVERRDRFRELWRDEFADSQKRWTAYLKKTKS